ncbi:hypothetical protein BC827DRAFT_819739 [Russula dissimulans]|nr:hypothetical protein BC827DRAFT_819739 [Russula dissimulans]
MAFFGTQTLLKALVLSAMSRNTRPVCPRLSFHKISFRLELRQSTSEIGILRVRSHERPRRSGTHVSRWWDSCQEGICGGETRLFSSVPPIHPSLAENWDDLLKIDDEDVSFAFAAPMVLVTVSVE